jgi:hypothetical protein
MSDKRDFRQIFNLKILPILCVYVGICENHSNTCEERWENTGGGMGMMFFINTEKRNRKTGTSDAKARKIKETCKNVPERD